MATALDLLMDAKEDVNLLSEESDICTIDAKTRAIFVPSTIVIGGVQSDKNAERIKFSCPKIVGDNLDLSKFSVRINFENVSSVDFNVSIKDQYICDDVAVDGENVTFSWLIGRNAARYMGTVRFIVCAVKTDSDSNISVEWNTAIAEVPVLEGIEIDQPQIGQEEKDVINQLLELTKNTSAEAVQNVNSAKEQAIKDIQSVSQPDTTLTIEGGLAEAKATGEAIGSLKEDLVTLETTKDGAVTVEKTDFFKSVPLSQNRFNAEAAPYINGKIYTGTKENTSKNADYYISDEMLIEPGKQYYQNFEAACVLYDSAHKYVRTIAWNESPFTTDANAKYIRCSVKTVDKDTKYIGESKWANVNVIAYTGDKTEISNKSVERLLKGKEKIDALEYQYSSNRFNKKSEENIDGYYLNKGRRIANEAYFITHLIPVEPNTQYFKNENGDGVFYDKDKNIIKWLFPDTTGRFTTPENCAFYQTSATINIKNKFYVSTINNIGDYKETIALTDNGKKAVDDYILPQVDRKIENSKQTCTKVEVSSLTLPYVNAAPSVEDCVVTFIDDDGDKAVYTALYPLLKEKNIKFGVALVTGKIGEASGLLTLDQLKEMHNSGHIETLSHCHTNYNKMPTLTKTQMDYQYNESKNWLKSNGFEYSAFVFPQNTTDRLSRTEARKYFDYCFTGIARNGNEFIDPSKIYRLAYGSYESYNPQISGIEGTDTLEYYKACIDSAYETGEWLIFNTHVGVSDTHTTENQIEMLSNLIDYIVGKGIKILSPSEAFALKRNLVSVGDVEEEYLFIGRKGFATNLFTVQVGGFKGEKLSNNSPITDFKTGMTSIITVNYSQGSSAGFPTQAGILETYHDKGYAGWSYQKWISYQTCKVYMRFWDEDTTKAWLDWVLIN